MLSEGTIVGKVHPEDVIKDGAPILHKNASQLCPMRKSHPPRGGCTPLHMKLNDLEALDGNKNILQGGSIQSHTPSCSTQFLWAERRRRLATSRRFPEHFQKTGKRTDPFTGLPVVGEIRRNAKLKNA